MIQLGEYKMEDNTLYMFFNNKPATMEDLRNAFAALRDLDTIELKRVDEHGRLFFEVNTFELLI